MSNPSDTDSPVCASSTANPEERSAAAPFSLKVNFSWTLLGNVVYAGCQWGILIILAKLGNPEMIGQFAFGLAVTAPIFVFANMALRPILATDTGLEYRFADYLGLRLVTTALAMLIVLGFAGMKGFHRETALVIIAVGLAKAFESVSDIYYGFHQQNEWMARIAQSMILKGVLSVAFLGTVVYLTDSVFWGTMSLATVWCVTLLGIDRRHVGFHPDGSPRPRWNPAVLKNLAFLALPLAFSTMLVTLSANIPRYFIERYSGERELGLFAAMAFLMVASATVINALGQSASPRLAKYYATRDRHAFRSLLGKLVIIGTLLGALGILVVLLAGREILAVIYRPEYAKHSDVLLLLMIAAAAGNVASFLGYGMTASRFFRAQPVVFGVSALLSTTGCALLVPAYGMTGAAWTCILVNTFQLAMMAYCNIHALRVLKD